MNDIVLSSLLNLFALFGSKRGISKEDSLAHVLNFLRSYSGIRDVQPYVTLFEDLSSYYSDFPELDIENVIEGICQKLKGQLPRNSQGGFLLRIVEFCNSNHDTFDPSDPLIRKIVSAFEIPEWVYKDYIDFVTAVPGDDVLVIELEKGKGVLKTLYLQEYNYLVFTYLGDEVVLMNDIPVVSGMYQMWQQSGVLKVHALVPMYYSSIMKMYDRTPVGEAFDLCGRDINFRFQQGGDNGMHNLSFTLHSGELVAIMGGSGVGKSTLLSLLNGNLKPQEGSITINGHDISEPAAKAHIGFVPQDDLLIEELTVYQNLWFTAKLCFDRMPDAEIDSKVMEVLSQLGLSAAKDLKVGSPMNKSISGGQRKRLNIALELIREPAILFLDEPTSGLSSADTENVINLLKAQTCKGRLVVVNIHQPSSDVYKLFDRLWLLDKGGYPVFDGNPIEAISYFKTAANYADSAGTACPSCGNVNPEIVLNIIDEKALDTSGKLSERRKWTPQEWHELYLKNREEQQEPQVSDVPPTDQKRPSILKQMSIFFKRNVSSKITNLQYVLVTLFEAPVLAAICAFLTKYTPDGGTYSIMENKNLVSYFFMAIIVAIFLGMSGSAEEIIKDRVLLKREKFLRLSYGSYITSKILYMGVVCLIQTLLFILVGNSIMGLHGLFWVWWMILFISAFLSSLIGLLLSQCMNSVVAIYITIPLLLIPQILLCGLVVKFDDLNPGSETGNVPIIGDFIPSRWSYEALAVANFSMNAYEKEIYAQDRDKYTNMYFSNAFLYELEAQLEQRQDENLRSDKEENPKHLEIIKTELSYLTGVCNAEPYSGDWSYESVHEYLETLKSYLNNLSNKTTLAIDRQLSAYIRENGKDQLSALKRDNYNIQLENLVLNRETNHMYMVRGTHIVPRSGYIFLTPRSKNGRAPFYSGVKVMGSREIPTLWFNVGVLLLMCVLIGVCLYSDIPGKYVRTEKN